MKLLKIVLLSLMAISGAGFVAVMVMIRNEKAMKAAKQTEAARAARWKGKKEQINEQENESISEFEKVDSADFNGGNSD